MRRLFAITRDLTGTLPKLPGVYPDSRGPIMRGLIDGDLKLSVARWRMPGPPRFGGAPITTIRNTKSTPKRRWLGPSSRCLMTVTRHGMTRS
jgi:putative SOS response-associated peptidase YedK